jgi:L-2-hydroxyglutarate oxidase LhgO
LVYPIAEAGGLGVHATLDLAGAVKFGPDVRWINEIDYQFNDDKKSDFVTAIARYYPAIEASNLDPAYTGIRPKIGGQDNPNVDFCIQTPRDHGIFGLINLFGIESPGLTSALSLGSAIAEIVQS